MAKQHCKICGYKWVSRTASPKQCARCKRYDYKESKKLTLEERYEQLLLELTRLLSAQEVAQLLGVNVQRIYLLVRKGLLPAVLLGQRQIRFNEEILKQWIDKGGSKGDK